MLKQNRSKSKYKLALLGLAFALGLSVLAAPGATDPILADEQVVQEAEQENASGDEPSLPETEPGKDLDPAPAAPGLMPDQEQSETSDSDTSAEIEAPVIAPDLEIVVGETFDPAADFEGLEFDPSAETVRFIESKPAFDRKTVGEYELSYEAVAHNGQTLRRIIRKVRVEPKPDSSGSQTSSSESSEDSSQDDADPLPGDEESSKQEAEEDKKDEEAKDDVDQDSSSVQSSEEEKQPEKKAAKAKISISKSTTYSYPAYQMGPSYSTSLYYVTYNGQKYAAYCSVPSKVGPTGSVSGSVKPISGTDLIAKILYYGAKAEDPLDSPAGIKGFFNQTIGGVNYSNMTAGQRFIITHLALGIADNDPAWFHGTNENAQAYARALHDYAAMQSLPAPTKKPQLSPLNPAVSYDWTTKKQTTQTMTFTGNPEQSASFTLQPGMTVVNRGPKT